MQTAHELFIHELTDMLSAERQLVEALGKQAEESSRPELKKAFESHREQTEKQVQRLEQCFDELGEEPGETESKGIKGLIEEHDSFMEEEDPEEDIADIFNVGAATKVEHYEICAYEGLIRLADLMEHKKVSKLLSQNLKEEEQTAKKMESFSKKLKPEKMGMDEEEEDEEYMESDEEEGDELVEAGPERQAGNRKSPGRSKSRRGRAA
jgi:ferritin-like metal-binding protein YciE